MKSMTNTQKCACFRLKGMLYAYLAERSAEKTLSYFTEDVQSIGFGSQKAAFDKGQLRKLIESELAADPFPFKLTFETMEATAYNSGRIVSVYTVLVLEKECITGIPVRIKLCQTAQLCKINEEFYIRTIHSSTLENQMEDELRAALAGKKSGKAEPISMNSSLFSLLNETMPGGIIGSYNEIGYPFYFINKRMLEYLGYTYDEFIEMIRGHIINCIYPADRSYVEAVVAKAFQKEDTYAVTYRMVKKNNSLVWIYEKGRRILTESGREAIISICFDITKQVEAENELSFIAQSQIGGIFKARMDDNFTVLYANECYYQIHGLTRQKMEKEYHNSAAALVHPDDIAAVSEQISHAIEQKQTTIALEYRVIRDDGKVAWLHASAGFNDTNDGVMMCGMVINIDERKSFEQQLQWSEKRFQIALDQTNIKVWEYDIVSRCILQTEKSHQIFGKREIIPNVPEEQIKSNAIHPDDARQYVSLHEKLHRGEKTAEAVIRFRTAEDKYRWEKIKYTNIFDENGTPVRAVAAAIDITAQKETERRFFQEEQLREMLSADILVSAKINLSQNKVFYAWSENYRPEALMGFHTYEQLTEAIKDFIANPGDRKRFAEHFSLQSVERAAANGEKSLYGEYRCLDKNGQILWCAFHLIILLDPETSEQIIFSYIRDINERKKTELALQERAERDSLTGLYNRQTAESMICHRIAQGKNSNAQSAFFIIDLDNFKQINDRFGHYFGDKILQEVGRILSLECYGKSIIGRLGGDEFFAFTEEIPSKQWVRKIAARICDKLNINYSVDGVTLQTSVSIGVVITELRNADFQKLFQSADSALYDAKSQGKGKVVCYGKQEERHEIHLLNRGRSSHPHPTENCMLDELEDCVLIIDENNHNILYMNRAACKEFHTEDYHQKKCYQVLQGFSQPCVFCQSHFPEEGYQTWENTNARLDKRFLIRDKMISWGGKQARLEVFTDISGYPSLSKAQLQADKVLLECLSILLSVSPLDTAVEKILETLGQYYQADRVYSISLTGNNALKQIPREWRAPGCAAEKEEHLETSPPDRWLEELRTRQIITFHQDDFERLHELFPQKALSLKKKAVFCYTAGALFDNTQFSGYFGMENPRCNLDNTALLQTISRTLFDEIRKRQKQEQLEYLSDRDSLTGLFNWQSFSKSLSHIQPDALSSLGILVAEVNHLRLLNQEYGDNYGNELLRSFAQALQKEFELYSSFRISGDLFLMLCPDITYEIFDVKAKRLRNRMDIEYPGCISFGCSWADSDLQPNHLINDAFEFLSITKSKESELTQNSRLFAIRMQHLKDAFQKNCFHIYLQPKADLQNGKIIGAEALIRYFDELHGLVPPDKFIPQLEAENNIRHIDFFVLEEVCKILHIWRQKGKPLFPISMNFSRSTLMEENIVDKINAVADRYKINHALLEIEITESKGVINRRALTETSRKLAKAGYPLFLDDFGAEYSNISILSDLSLNGLKFDKSIIHDLYSNPTTRLLVESLIRVCGKMGISSIAEGVEEPEQLEILKSFGCTFAQGYLFNKPIPTADFERKYLEYPFSSIL